MNTPTPQLSDTALVGASLRNPEAYSAIISAYSPAIDRYIRRLGVHHIHDREDLLQEIFIKVYINLNDYDPMLKFSSWIYRIAHNETMSFFRKKQVRPQPLSLEAYPTIETGSISIEDLEESFDRVISKAQLMQALYLLDDKYREVLILNYFEEKRYDEMADILKKPPGTIATLLSRAKAQLKKILIEQHHA